MAAMSPHALEALIEPRGWPYAKPPQPMQHGLRPFLDKYNATIVAFTIAFSAVAVVNVLEVHVLLWLTFRKYQGLYFWSIFAAVWGIITGLIAGVVVDNCWILDTITAGYLAIIFQPSWWAMITGQSLVLYSRLHLVLQDKRRRYVLYMIVVDAVLFHTSTTVCALMGSLMYSAIWTKAANNMEKVNVSVFFVQETIISAIYIWQCRRLLLSSSKVEEEKVYRRVLRDLIWINALVISMGCAVIGTSYAGLMPVEQSLKTAVYAYKLRLEFIILNQLTSLVKPGCRSLDFAEIGTFHHSAAIDDARIYSLPETRTRPGYGSGTDTIQIAYGNPAGYVMREVGVRPSSRFVLRK